MYTNVTYKQVIAHTSLVRLMLRLRITGSLEVTVKGVDRDMIYANSNSRYSIIKRGYDPSRLKIDQIELLESMFGRLSQELEIPLFI